ncbi:MAG: nitrous oxide reductase accessory protein NosL [Bacteroidetes bacterium]|nr:nitrous oxide reductase accessory protein NosL [Bacteroidota bacterium]
MKTNKKITTLCGLALFLFLNSCKPSGPERINLNKDNCDNCNMSISDSRFACELVTEKGRVYKFDDVLCMINYKKDNQDKANEARFYVSHYLSNNELLLSDNLFFVEGEAVASPMGGNTAAFSNKDSAQAYAHKWEAKIISWKNINP